MLRNLLLTVLAFLLLASPAAAAVRYASPTSGVNAGACASVAAACTLTYAVNGGPAASEIVVLPGSYSVTAALALPVGGFIHGAVGSARPVIHTTVAAGGLTTSGAVAGNHISDLELKGEGITNGLIRLNGAGVLVENVVLHATGANAVALVEYGTSGVTTVRDTVATAAGTNAQAMWFGGQPAHVRNVTAWATGAGSTGVTSSSDFFMVGMSCVGQGRGQVDVASSIVHGDDKDLQLSRLGSCGALPTMSAKYSYFATKGEQGATIDVSGGHNVTAAAAAASVFVAPGTDFHELPGAATIDAGAVDQHTGTRDVDGFPRVRDLVDIGASEFTAPELTILPATAGPTFAGTVNPRGLATVSTFEYGPDTSYGSSTAPVGVGADSMIHALSAAPAGLDPAATYHVRITASQGNANYTRTVHSADMTYVPAAVAPPLVETPPAVYPPVVTPPQAPKPKTVCKVPKLKRLTRTVARKRLKRAHCALGKVRGRKGGRVKTQSRKAGTRLKAGTKVSVRLT